MCLQNLNLNLKKKDYKEKKRTVYLDSTYFTHFTLHTLYTPHDEEPVHIRFSIQRE